MVSKKLKVVNSEGFHMRPANAFATAMAKYKSDVKIETGKTQVNAKSVMNLIAACIKFGTEITIVCDGEDENEALAEAAGMVESGFGEK